ncbi:hypothetical protein GGQ95_003208 [Anoxybacillus rupiensis]|nr:hypothetical protein [Anoxybacillus rupiensis]
MDLLHLIIAETSQDFSHIFMKEAVCEIVY